MATACDGAAMFLFLTSVNYFTIGKCHLQVQRIEEQNHIFSNIIFQSNIFELTIDNSSCFKGWSSLSNSCFEQLFRCA